MTDSENTITLSEPSFLTIPSKPTAPIFHTFIPATSPTSTHNLIIFINGLGLPASFWNPALEELVTLLPSHPAILTYDRYNQGLTTSPDPLDSLPGKEHGHDFLDIVNDLHEIILVIATQKLGLSPEDIVPNGKLQLLLIGASIGGPISRLYSQHHPGLLSGLILLDSNIANSNYSDFLPDPSSPSFNASEVIEEDCTLEEYIDARNKLKAMFDLNVKNREGVDRRNGPELLPSAQEPKLKGWGGRGPWVSVVGHDWIVFGELSWEMMGTPRSLTRKFTNPYWGKYNEGLTKITDEGRCEGVKIAKRCGHFIQKDDPEFVAKEVASMIQKMGW